MCFHVLEMSGWGCRCRLWCFCSSFWCRSELVSGPLQEQKGGREGGEVHRHLARKGKPRENFHLLGYLGRQLKVSRDEISGDSSILIRTDRTRIVTDGRTTCKARWWSLKMHQRKWGKDKCRRKKSNVSYWYLPRRARQFSLVSSGSRDERLRREGRGGEPLQGPPDDMVCCQSC